MSQSPQLIPIILHEWREGYGSRAMKQLAKEEIEQMPASQRLEHVWADADLVTPRIRMQVPQSLQVV